MKIPKNAFVSSSCNFYRSTWPNLNLKCSRGAELSVEHDGIERNERGGVYTDQFVDFQLECFRIQKNTSFNRDFGCNRLIETIDDYDGTVHGGPFQLSRSRPMSIDGLDAL